MKLFESPRPSPALIVAMIALVAAMSGAAIALPGKGTVSSNDIKKNAVRAKHIERNAVRSQEVSGKSLKGNDLRDGAVKAKQIADDAIESQQVAENGLNGSDLSDYEVIGSGGESLVKVTATEAASEAAARTAAPETTLFSKGEATLYAKCFRDTAADTTFAEIYVRTSADGAIFDGSADELNGGSAATDFLNATTAETDRQLDTASVTGADATIDEGEFTIVTPGGTHLIGQNMIAAKNGALAGGNGVYGDGNSCLFGGEIAG